MPTDTELVERYLEYVRTEKRLAQRTVALYALDMGKLQAYAAGAAGSGASALALREVSHHQIRRWIAQMHSGGRSGRGIALILSGWRGFYVWLGRQGLVSSNPVQDVRAPKAPKPLPKAMGVDDAVRFADFCSEDRAWFEARDAAMVELLYGSGLRVGELVGLDVQPGPQAKGWIDLKEAQAHVLGKGPARAGALAGPTRHPAGPGQDAHRPRPARSHIGQRGASSAVYRAQWHPLESAVGMATPAAAQPVGAHQRTGAPAHAAPLVRQPCAAVQQRPARCAGVARPRQYQHHPGLHAAGFPTFGQGL